MPSVTQMDFSLQPSEVGTVSAVGCELAYAVWGASDPQPVVLVHGAGAQMGWWDAVVARLADRHRIIALDLSGHGDSGRRARYTGESWAADVAAVAEHVGGANAVLVGHSLGGRIAIIAAARHPELVTAMVLVDVPVRDPSAPRRPVRTPAARQYVTLEAALQSFHLRPNEPVLDRELLMRVAANSFTSTGGRWALKADPMIYGRIEDAALIEYLRQIDTPITHVYGDQSAILDDQSRMLLCQSHRGVTELIAVRGGFHHLTFDHADAIAAVITDVVARTRGA